MAEFYTSWKQNVYETFEGDVIYNWRIGFSYSYTQNQSENYTTLYRTINFYYTSNNAEIYVGFPSKFTIGGGTSTDFYSGFKVRGSASGTIKSDSIRIYHNEDGTIAPITLSITYSGNASQSYSTASTTLQLPQILRASVWKQSTMNVSDIQSSFNLPITKYVSSYYNVVTLNNNAGTTTIKTIENAVNNTSVTLNSTELNSLYSIDSNSTAYPLVFYMNLKTYSNSSKTTQIGTTQRITCYAYLVNGEPTFDIAYQDTNQSTLAITNDNQQIIQNNSTLQFNLTNITAKNGATLDRVSININGIVQSQSVSSSTLNFNYGVINVSNDINAIVTLYDSRGLNKVVNVPLEVLAWANPSALITLQRQSNYYTSTELTVDANYSSLDSKNSVTIQYRYKKQVDSTWGSWANLSDNVTTTFNADNLYDWDIQVQVSDLIGTTTYDLTLGIGQPIMFIDKRNKNVGIDCFAKSTNALEVNGNAEISGDLIVNNVNILNRIKNPSAYVQSFSRTANWTTSSTTDVSIPNASKTITTDGGSLLVFANLTMGVTGNMAFISIYVDGTRVGSSEENFLYMDASLGTTSFTGVKEITGLSAGTHTIEFKVHVQNSSNVFTLRAYNQNYMTIIEH